MQFDDEVERSRRCHLNDLENIYPFVLVGLLYVATDPSLAAAKFHFYAFVISRFAHTFVYLSQIRQPARSVCFVTGFAVTISMILQILAHFA